MSLDFNVLIGRGLVNEFSCVDAAGSPHISESLRNIVGERAGVSQTPHAQSKSLPRWGKRWQSIPCEELPDSQDNRSEARIPHRIRNDIWLSACYGTNKLFFCLIREASRNQDGAARNAHVMRRRHTEGSG